MAGRADARELEQAREERAQQRVRRRPPVALGDATRACGRRTCAGTGPESRRRRSARRRRGRVARSCRKSSFAHSPSRPPRPALMTMPNSRELSRPMRSSTPGESVADAAPASNWRSRLEHRASSSVASSVSRPAPAAWRKIAVAAACAAAVLESGADGCGTIPIPFAMPDDGIPGDSEDYVRDWRPYLCQIKKRIDRHRKVLSRRRSARSGAMGPNVAFVCRPDPQGVARLDTRSPHRAECSH